MKKNFTKAVLLTLTVVGMGMFNSCKDHDLCEDVRLDLDALTDKHSKLEDVVKNQGQLLEELKDKIENIKSCQCTLTPEKVQQMIDDALKSHLTSVEFTTKITEIINNMGFQTVEDVKNIIKDYMAQNPGSGLTAEQVQQMIDAAVEKLATKDALEDAVNTLNDALEHANGRTDSLVVVINKMNQAAAEAIGKLNAVSNKVDSLDLVIAGWGPKLEETIITANKALELAKKDSAMIADMQRSYKDLADADSALKAGLDSLAKEMDKFATKQELSEVLQTAKDLHKKALAYTDSVTAETLATLGQLEGKFNTLESTVTELQGKVNEIYPKVQENSKAIEAMKGYLNKLITNIIIQGVSNPVFGSFAFPWGVQSNMLMGYYGESDVDINFPTIRTANYVYKEYALTAEDAKMLGNSVESLKKVGQSMLVENTPGNAGKVYLTINPTNVDFEGTNFSLVNSQDENSPVKLGTITKSNAKLQFGVSRAANNGFYEATASFDENNIPTTGVNKTLVFNSLKDVAKDVLDYENGVDLKGAAKKMFNVLMELDCDLDANGVKAAWTVDGQNQSVYSKYEIAAFAVHPLSYAFLYGENIGTDLNDRIPDLPMMDPITDAMLNDLIDLDKINIELELDFSDLNFTIDPIDVVIPEFDINFKDVVINDLGNIEAEVEMPKYEIQMVNGEPTLVIVGYEIKKVPVDTDKFKDAIEDAMNDALANAGTEISESIREQLDKALQEQLDKAVANIQNSVNDLIQNQLQEQINGQLDGAIKDVMQQIKDQITSGAGDYIDKANDYIAQINKWSGRFNELMGKLEEYLNNLNAKLQVAMLYKGGDGEYHQLSNNKNMPTTFTGEGVANLFATSYTGEIIAPAFKKFVGVTNVFKGNASAQGGDAECKSALDAVNGGEYFNKVIPGSRYGIAMQNLKKGYTYEIFYSGLDYSGKISARKFYISIK